MQTTDTRTSLRGWGPWRLLAGGILAVLLGTGAGRVLIRPVCVVEGGSMLPTLQPGARLYAEAASGPLNRGDIVVFQDPKGEAAVKRVIGLPGETVRLWRGHVFIDGRMLLEPYLGSNAFTYPTEEATRGAKYHVNQEEYFLLGDNRLCSEDGRSYGPVRREQIQRRVVLRHQSEVPAFAPFTLPAEGEAMIQFLATESPHSGSRWLQTSQTY